jgi:hypothetical protein
MFNSLEQAMQAVRETTDWGTQATSNHTYLLDGNNLVAYIKQGHSEPFYFKSPIKGFDKRGRTFESADDTLFAKIEKPAGLVEVQGSKGQVYSVDLEAQTCTCPGFTFRGACKHVKELA